jgi:8-oxo-dGTP pyrophosphatase MutT (NUDIX family)
MIRQKFRISCKVALYDFEKEMVLVVEYKKGQYGLPGGHLELNENPEEAARRELKEELGIDYNDYLVLKDSWVQNNERVLLGFVGKLTKGTKLTIQSSEIRSARWTTFSEIQKKAIRIDLYREFILENTQNFA